MARYGMSIPLGGIPLDQQGDIYKKMIDWGYTDFWSSEADGADGFTPLALAAAWTPTARLGVAIIPAFTRGPAVIAQTAAAMAEAAPGRFVMGVGASSNVIVERWNDIAYERPYYKTRDVVRFLKKAFAGERVAEEFDTFKINGFRLGRLPEIQPKILVAALQKGMLKMAGRESDGAILNWLSAEDVKTVVPYVHEGGPDKEIAARIFVIPSADKDLVYASARRGIAAYLNVPVYAAFHEWLGRGELLGPLWKAWKAGDRKKALTVIPDEVIDDIFIWGRPEECREKIQQYVEAGVHTPALAMNHPGDDMMESIRLLSPSAA